MKNTLKIAAAVLAALALASCAPKNSLVNPNNGDKVSDTVTTVPAVTDDTVTDDTLTTETVDTAKIYSGPLKENGRYDLTATDYVKIDKSYLESIVIPKSAHSANEDELTLAIAEILSPFADSTVHLDREIKLGDTVNIDYVGSIDGVEFPTGTTAGAGTNVTIGLTNYIDDFLYQLIGHKPGETVNVKVTFPVDYGDEALNGKEALFVTKINYILKTPELTDAFIAENLSEYGFTSAAELTSYLEEQLVATTMYNFISDLILNKIEVTEIPEIMVLHQIDQMIEYYRDYGSYYGMGLDEFLTAIGTTQEQLIEESRADCEGYARYMLVCQAIAEIIGYEPQETDVLAYFGEYNGTTDITDYKEYYGMPYLKCIIIEDHVFDYIENNCARE